MTNAWAKVIYGSGMTYDYPLDVTTLRVSKTAADNIAVELISGSSQARGYFWVAPKIAVPLARAILSVAEGYISVAEQQIN
jgi:hypothetical protein